MSWVYSLSLDDLGELRGHVRRFGPTAFELYVILTLVITLNGPFPAGELAGNISDHGELDWHRIKGEFELRDGFWHIKPRPAMTAIAESERA